MCVCVGVGVCMCVSNYRQLCASCFGLVGPHQCSVAVSVLSSYRDTLLFYRPKSDTCKTCDTLNTKISAEEDAAARAF